MVAQPLRLRFGSRFLLLCITLACLGTWWFDFLPWRYHHQQRISGQSLIHSRDRIHISQCFDKPALDRLITVLGDSRMSHWASIRWLLRPDPETVVSYGSDNALIIWDYEVGSIRRGFFDAVCATYASGAQRVYWIDSAGALYELSLREPDAKPAKLLHKIKTTRNGYLLSSTDGRYLVHTAGGSPISVWDLSATAEVQPLVIPKGQFEWPLACALNESSVLVAGSSVLLEYDLATGETKNTIELPQEDDGKARVSACAFCPDGETFIVGDASGQIFEIDWNTRSVRGEFISNGNTITSLSAGKDTFLAAGGGVLRYHWYGDPRQMFVSPVTANRVTCLSADMTGLGAYDGGRIVELGDGPSRMKGDMGSDATCFAFSPDGKQIALAGRDGQIAIRDTHNWQLTRSWIAHQGSIQRLIWSAGPQPTLFSTGDELIVAWNPKTTEELESTHLWSSRSETIAFHASADRMVMAGAGKESLVFLKPSNLERLEALTVDQLRVRGDVLFSHDGASLIAGGSQNTVLVWSIGDKKLTASLGRQTFDEVRLALSLDGKVVYAGSSDSIAAFDLSAAKPLWTALHGTTVQDISRHPNKPVIAAVGSDGAVVLYDADTGTVIQRLRVGPTAGKLTQIDFSPDGSLLAIAMSNGSVVVLQSPLE